ncbi:MAG TPA: F0F1 ATP synthase subunit A [Catalimonadaceae bacterium]|nr:F0F1 ATP synthase subunit A [Catalimonadaceae bacterium]
MKSNTFKAKLLQIFLLVSLTLGFAAKADDHEAHSENKFDISTLIFHHISDSHEWHFATIGHTHLSINLPVILWSADRGIEVFSFGHLKGHGDSHEVIEYQGYTTDHHGKIVSTENREFRDFSITKNVASLFLSVVLLFVVFFSIAGAYKKRQGLAPKGLQSFFEPIIVFIRDEIALPNIGKKHERFLPYLLTVFFFIWFNNLLGLMPGGANLTGNIAVTFCLAFITLVITVFSGNKDYWMHILWTPGIPLWLRPILIPVELVGIISKPFSLMIRLFANITAGHVIILSLLGLTFIFRSVAVGVAATLFSTVMSLLELFVAILQAYVFTLLSAMYFGQATAEHEHHEGHH